jgi:hypothetical protein
MSLNESVVASSTCMRAGRSARAHTTPELIDTSPDCTPWLTCGRSPARLIAGQATAPTVPAAAAVLRNRRRETKGARRMVGFPMMRIPPS